MTNNQFGLALGLFIAFLHAVWSVAVAIIPNLLQQFINWVLALHHINLPMTITAFNMMNAIILVILTFVVGYIFGYILGVIVKAIKK